MKRLTAWAFPALLAVSGMVFAGGFGPQVVHAAPCAGYAATQCQAAKVPPHAMKFVPEPTGLKKAFMYIVVTGGNKASKVEVKEVKKPANAPKPPAPIDSGTPVYFSVTTKGGKPADIKVNGKGFLFEYNPATNTWKRVRPDKVQPGKIYSWVWTK